MLEYWKDGKSVSCKAIYGRGRVGQVVILDHVSYGDNPDLEKHPLARYIQPYAFTIVEKVEGRDGYCIVVDAEGNRIVLQGESGGSYLYDANEWCVWQREYEKEKLARKDGRIAHLESQVALLKSILVSQGMRLITKEQAAALDIKV